MLGNLPGGAALVRKIVNFGMAFVWPRGECCGRINANGTGRRSLGHALSQEVDFLVSFLEENFQLGRAGIEVRAHLPGHLLELNQQFGHLLFDLPLTRKREVWRVVQRVLVLLERPHDDVNDRQRRRTNNRPFLERVEVREIEKIAVHGKNRCRENPVLLRRAA